MNARMVNHVNQGKVEYYDFHRSHGWYNVPASEGENWKPSEFDYYELRHSQDMVNGLYGSHIKG